jgi:precorrin-6B methylase 2
MKQYSINPANTLKLYELISRYWTACAMHAVARLKIADLLFEKPLSITELADKTNSDEQALYRLMRAVCSEGIFEETADKTFQLNELGSGFLSNISGSIAPWALANLGEHFAAFGKLTEGIQSGKVPFEEHYGMQVWDYYKQNPERGENLVKAMAGVSGAVIEGITKSYDFTPYKTIVDIGGGNGALLFGVLNAAPDSNGIVFDEPYVIEATKKNIPDHLKSRCEVEGGSFFENIPAGADLYMTKWVLHDWNDEQVAQILKVAYEAMKPGSKLLIIEAVIPDQLNQPHASKLLDLNIYAMTTGKERTETEFKSLLAAAGLKFRRLILTNTELSGIIECEKI